MHRFFRSAICFFFADEDWDANGKGSATKVWDYVACKNDL